MSEPKPLDGGADVGLPGVQSPADGSDETPQDPDAPFQPIVTSDPDSDWIKLKSGEWLRGSFTVLRNESVEFDSKELKKLTLDWEDIHTVRLPTTRTVLLESGEVLQGTVLVLDDSLVLNGDPTRRIERSRVLSIVDVSDGRAAWSGKVSLGYTERQGNTEQTDFSSYVFGRRETAATRWDTSYNGAYSRVSGTETSNNHRLKSRLDWFLSSRLYVTPAGFDLFRDKFQNIAVRVTPYAAVGYELINWSKLDWTISAGPAYQYTTSETVAPGDPASDGTAAVVLQSRFEWDVTSDIDFDVNYDITVPVPDVEAFNHHAVVMLSVELTDDFDLDISWNWDRVNRPTADESGAIPAQDDFRSTVGIGYEW